MTTPNRPDRETLKRLLENMPQAHIAKAYGVTDNTVYLWRKKLGVGKFKKKYTRKAKYKRTRKSIDELPNPIVECQCGCGKTFKKYRIHYRENGRNWRKERRFAPGHGGGAGIEKKRLRWAEHWAREVGDHTKAFGATYTPHPHMETDFHDEYIGEAWLAIAEQDYPKLRADEIRKENNRHKNNTCNIEAVLRHPDICEQACYEDPPIEGE